MADYTKENNDSSPINFYSCKDISGKTHIFIVISSKLMLVI